MDIKILAISDVEIGMLYSSQVAKRFSDIDLLISCGDLPMFYIDYIASTLNIPAYYVYGNHHCQLIKKGKDFSPNATCGHNLHCAVENYDKKILMAGIEGCVRYNRGEKQYSQYEMWLNVLSLVPKLIWNKLRYGRYLDIFITHSPPWKIHDETDRAHQGIKAFRWFLKTFKPKYHLHGHIHVYRSDTVVETVYYQTRILNCYGYKEILLAAETKAKS